MKTLLILIMTAATMLGGSMTITTTAPQDARIVAAYGSVLNLGRDATAAEVKAAIINYIRQTVQDYERRQNMATFTPAPIDPN